MLDKKERAAIELLTGRALETGNFSGRLWADEFEIEVTIVRRRPPGDELRRFQAAALAHLMTRPYAVAHCGCNVTHRSRGWSSMVTHCSGRIVAAVVTRPSIVSRDGRYQTAGADDLDFLFICGRHRTNHGIEPKAILGIVELTEAALAPARKLLATTRAEHEARWRKEEEGRERERQAAIAADPQHIHRRRPGGPLPSDPNTCWDCGTEFPPLPAGPPSLKLIPLAGGDVDAGPASKKGS